jgi:hypothetical protein
MMKKIILAIYIFLSLECCGQVWIEKGAVWHYDWYTIGSGGFDKIMYTGDTVIGSKTCQTLLKVRYAFFGTPNGGIAGGLPDTLGKEFTYASGDTVFYFVNNKFSVLYNFGAKPGDTWNLGIDTSFSACSKSIAIVDSIGTMMINSNSYRWISLSAKTNSSVTLLGKALERMGSIGSYLFLLYNFCDNQLWEPYFFNFHCFSDQAFDLYNPTGNACEYLLERVGTTDLQPEIVEIYPNPAGYSITIQAEGHSIKYLEIFDYQGKLVSSRHSVPVAGQLIVSDLKKGLYFVHFIDESGRPHNGKFIKL